MATIEFLGMIDQEEIMKLEKSGVRFIKQNQKNSILGVHYISKKLGKFKVICDWISGYEDGTVEFTVDYSPNEVELDSLRKAIQNLKGTVRFVSFKQ